MDRDRGIKGRGDDEMKKKTRHSKKNERVAVGRWMDDREREQ